MSAAVDEDIEEKDVLQCKVCGGLYLGTEALYDHIDTVHNKGEEE